MSSKKEESKRDWLTPTITTVIGIIASIVIGWYQINISEEEEREAEKERQKSVKNELVLIVEEHIINEKALDVSTISRLAELRGSQESLISAPTVREIIETAEFNILKSQYLEFEKKEQYKRIFDEINKSYLISKDFNYSGIYKNSVDDLHASIIDGNIKESSVKLNELASEFDAKISELQSHNNSRTSIAVDEFIKVTFENPKYIIVFFALYGSLLYFLVILKRRNRRRERQREQLQNEIYDEYRRERNEILKDKIFKNNQNPE